MHQDRTTPANKVMIVEDETLFQELIQDIFANENIEITCVSTGMEALQHPEHRLYVVDIGLPKMDGFATLEALKNQFGHTVPSILITGYDKQYEEGLLHDYGVLHVLQKPFDIGHLKKLIYRHFSTDEFDQPKTAQ